jgi:hypothetical protein
MMYGLCGVQLRGVVCWWCATRLPGHRVKGTRQLCHDQRLMHASTLFIVQPLDSCIGAWPAEGRAVACREAQGYSPVSWTGSCLGLMSGVA